MYLSNTVHLDLFSILIMTIKHLILDILVFPDVSTHVQILTVASSALCCKNINFPSKFFLYQQCFFIHLHNLTFNSC